MLTADGCASRQARFRAMLAAAELEAAILTDRRDLYWLCGLAVPMPFCHPALAYLEVDGPLWVFAPTGCEPLVADDSRDYPTSVGATQNPDCLRAVAELAATVLRGRRAGRLGFGAEDLGHWLAVRLAEVLQPDVWYSIDDELSTLQRRKDPDELACIRGSIAATRAAYDAVAEAIRAGANELDVLAAGGRAAMHACGQAVFHFGDYRCAEGGGPARDRRCAEGELYIVDAWTVRDGYWSDLCRTFAVGEMTDEQASVAALVADILAEVPRKLRPGLRGTELAAWIDARLREHPLLADTGLVHHAGHGFGLRAHTAPDLNRLREGILAEGDTVSVEPGAYRPELRAGVRLENSFLITADGCELLSDFPHAVS